MAFSILRALNIEKHERGVVFFLLAQSIFLGILAGALDVGANALFLDAYSANLMPRAFMISGAVGIVFTSLYTYLQKKMAFPFFTVLNLVIALLITGLLRLGYYLYDDPRLAFALLVMMGPLIIITMLGFWGTAGRYFTLREGKRLFGIIDTGSVIGMILAFYAVPILMNFNFNTINTLVIGAFSLVLALILQVVILRRYSFKSITKVKSDQSKKRSGIFSLFRSRYTALMAAFVMLSVITAFFIHYSFMWATEANYSESRELTSFLGAFFGTMMIFTVIIKSTLYGWLMKNYGVRVTLLISPVLLLILTLIASFVGGIFGFTAEAASFTFFFLLIALSKLFNKSLKDAVEGPSMKILYQSLDSSERFDIQAKIDGIINEFTAFGAGVIMAGLMFISFVEVIHFSYILIFILGIWVYLGVKLYRSYRKTLNDSLVAVRESDLEGKTETRKLYDESVIQSPLLIEMLKLDPYFYFRATPGIINRILEIEDRSKNYHAWNFLSGKLYSPPDHLVEKFLETGDENQAKKYFQTLVHGAGKDKLEMKSGSGNKQMIFASLYKIVEENDKSNLPFIITLFRDRDIMVRAATIEAAGKLKAHELGSYIVDYLGHPDLYETAWSALVNMGEKVLENLENTFHKAGVDVRVKLRIIKAMQEIGGEKANHYLFQKIDFHQRDIREKSIQALFKSEFTPGERAVSKISDLIYEAALAGGVNIANEAVIRENDPGNGLLEAILEEKQRNDQIIFMLLGIAYDRNAISHVWRSLEGSESVDAGYALELLNLLIDDQLFVYLEPYFDDLSVHEKIRRMQNEMPVEILPYENVLIDIMNRDGLYAGNYLRICAIDAIARLDDLDAGKYLAAQVFHPNPVISGAASVVLGEKDPSLFKNINERIDVETDFFTSEGFSRGHHSAKRSIQLVENFHQWRIFSSLPRERIMNFIHYILPQEENIIKNAERVTLVRRAATGDDILSDGLVIILSHYPEFMNHIEYLSSMPGLDYYQVDLKRFRELLFDHDFLLSCVIDSFKNPEADRLFDIKVKE